MNIEKDSQMDQSHLSRRALLGGAAATASLALAATAGAAPTVGTANPAPPSLTPNQSLAALKKGNRDFLAGRVVEPDRGGRRRRLEIARAQYPIAVLVSCSDSRVPPELLFGRGLGELFIIRNAGNTIDTVAMGSLEYAVAETQRPAGRGDGA